ncbi:MAG: imidazole glycerol phosphate synthase subunit HisH [Candidatus Omnitrophota bacterium]|jgi:glutamine amidotransferase
MRKVTIIKCGYCNILSVKRAFEHCGAEVSVSDSVSAIEKAERLVLPGVGAFADGMDWLKDKGLTLPIKEYVKTKRPFLGICLGMQMMFDESEEFGLSKGFGFIPGRVVCIPRVGSGNRPHKIPHIGWNSLEKPQGIFNWDNTLLQGINEGDFVYFVHSFTSLPDDESCRLADTYYDGCRISAVVRSGSLYGCQFHPEKSATIGLKIIKNFVELN